MRSDLRRLLLLASLKHFSPSLDYTARLDSEDTVRKDFDILCCSFTHVQVQVRFPRGTMQYNRRGTFVHMNKTTPKKPLLAVAPSSKTMERIYFLTEIPIIKPITHGAVFLLGASSRCNTQKKRTASNTYTRPFHTFARTSPTSPRCRRYCQQQVRCSNVQLETWTVIHRERQGPTKPNTHRDRLQFTVSTRPKARESTKIK